MTNTELLNKAIENSGISITFISKQMECSRNRVYSILAGNECTASEIAKLTEILHLTNKQRDNIFFANNSE